MLRKSKQFTVFDFIKKQETSDVISDSDTPKSCLLTQFHVVFAYSSNITVVSRVSQHVVYNLSLGSNTVSDISFD